MQLKPWLGLTRQPIEFAIDILNKIYVLYLVCGRCYEHRSVATSLRRLPKDVLERYEKRKDVVMISGPKGLVWLIKPKIFPYMKT